MKIIDAHLHLDDKLDGTAKGAARELNRQILNAGIEHALVLHLEFQQWSAEEVAEAINEYPRMSGFINLHPNSNNPEIQLQKGIENLGYIGLKLHPRLQEFDLTDNRTVSLVRFAGEIGIPVLIDAFPDGTHIMQGFSALKYAELARKCPNTKIIWAHMGGHHVLDFLMLAKRLPNVYFDISYSFLYYKDSSVPTNMIYAMRSMKFERIFYGSDYPDRSILETLNSTIECFKLHNVEDSNLSKIMGLNARNFFGWHD